MISVSVWESDSCCFSMLDEPHAKETHRCLEPIVVDPTAQIDPDMDSGAPRGFIFDFMFVHFGSFFCLMLNSLMPTDTFESFGPESAKTDLNVVFFMISECCSADLR